MADQAEFSLSKCEFQHSTVSISHLYLMTTRKVAIMYLLNGLVEVVEISFHFLVFFLLHLDDSVGYFLLSGFVDTDLEFRLPLSFLRMVLEDVLVAFSNQSIFRRLEADALRSAEHIFW